MTLAEPKGQLQLVQLNLILPQCSTPGQSFWFVTRTFLWSLPISPNKTSVGYAFPTTWLKRTIQFETQGSAGKLSNDWLHSADGCRAIECPTDMSLWKGVPLCHLTLFILFSQGAAPKKQKKKQKEKKVLLYVGAVTPSFGSCIHSLPFEKTWKMRRLLFQNVLFKTLRLSLEGHLYHSKHSGRYSVMKMMKYSHTCSGGKEGAWSSYWVGVLFKNIILQMESDLSSAHKQIYWPLKLEKLTKVPTLWLSNSK